MHSISVSRFAIRIAKRVGVFASLLCGFSNPAASQSAADSLPPVLLIHGFRSNVSTWDGLAVGLSGAGFSRVLRMNTLWSQNIVYQAGELATFATNNGIATESPILVAHSMGGLVARQLSVSLSSDALVTIGSPHQGHPLLKNVYASTSFYNIMFPITGAAAVVLNNLWRCGQTRNDDNGQPVDGPCFTIWEFLNFTYMVVGTLYTVHNLFLNGGAEDDMTPGSAFLNSLNSTAHIASEQTDSRVAILGQLNNYERPQSLFRMLLSEWEASNVGSYLPWFSGVVQQDGWEIIGETLWDDPWYWERILGGAAVVYAGAQIAGIPEYWNQLLGGWPNDGFMWTGTQSYGGATPVDAIGFSHGEENSSPILFNTIRALGAQYRRVN